MFRHVLGFGVPYCREYDLGRGSRFGAGECVGDGAVDVGGEGVAGVAEQVLHGVQAGRAVQRVHCGPVSQVVQPDRRQPMFGDQGGEAMDESAGPDRPPVRPREDEAGFLGRCSVFVVSALLLVPVVGEGGGGGGVEGDRS
jgi:hypothetical protein